jgi:hypothetical protein
LNVTKKKKLDETLPTKFLIDEQPFVSCRLLLDRNKLVRTLDLRLFLEKIKVYFD